MEPVTTGRTVGYPGGCFQLGKEEEVALWFGRQIQHEDRHL